MPMTTTLTLAYEGAPACVDCQRTGRPVCDHVGFNPQAWEPLIGAAVDVPGLDGAYGHTVTAYAISEDRKTLTLTVQTERPQFHDLARHLSTRSDVRAKAHVRAVHHESGDVLEEGWYDRFLTSGEPVCIDRDLYHVVTVEHPHRDPATGAADPVDTQLARLAPARAEAISPMPDAGAVNRPAR